MRCSAEGSGLGSCQQASADAEHAQLRSTHASDAQISADNPGQGVRPRGFQLWDALDAAAPAAHSNPAEWREVRSASLLALMS